MIPEIEVLNIVSEVGRTSHSPLKVLGSDFNYYFSKTPKFLRPEINIINEFIANALLQKWSIKTALAVKLRFPDNIINLATLSSNHQPINLKLTCFGSRLLEDASDFSDLTFNPSKRKFNNIDDFFKIALFDIWVENDDRKPTNPNLMVKLVSNKLNFFPIDHCLIFSTRVYKDLNPEYISVSFNDSLLETSFSKILYNSIKKNNWLVQIKDYFYYSVEQCQIDFDELISDLPKDLGLDELSISKIYEFLFSKDRNKKVFQEFCSRF